MTARAKSDLLDRIMLALFRYEYGQIQETEGWPEPLEPRLWRPLRRLGGLFTA